MSDPYHPPGTSAEPELPRTGMAVPDSVVSHFALVRPWARACSVAGFVTGLALLGLTAGSIVLGSFAPFTPSPPLLLFALVSLFLGAFAFAASAKLWSFSASIDQLCLSMDGSDLEVTVHLLHRFWRLAGIAAFLLVIWLGELAILTFVP